MSAPKLSFSLSAAKAKPVGAAPSLKRTNVVAFGDDEAQDQQDAAPTASSSSKASVNKQLVAQNVRLSRTTKAQQEEAKKIDNTVFEYDEVWDRMKEAELVTKMEKEIVAKDKKPKYIGSLLASAETRRLDHLRAEEKMMQREREAEGDEFADRESFVTQAYKDQIIEMRKAEEEEKKREEQDRAKQGATGMAHYYRTLLERNSAAHEAAVAATSVVGPTKPTQTVNLTITRPADMAPISDAQLAREAALKGQDVELNDSNEIVDRRELLAPGLNLSAPNTRKLGSLTSARNRPKPEGEDPAAHRAAGAAASLKEIRQRQARELATQLEQEQQRQKEQREREEREAEERRILRRNTETDVMSAKERYLARKKARLEQPDSDAVS